MSAPAPIHVADPQEFEKVIKNHEVRAADMIAKARSCMIMDKGVTLCFFSVLAMGLRLRPAWFISTAATDGKNLLYNPSFINSLRPREVLGVLIHEVLHCALKHVGKAARMSGHEDHERINIAMDLAINQIVLAPETGLELPEWVEMPAKRGFPDNLSTEEYYSLLMQERKDGGGNGNPQHGAGGQRQKNDNFKRGDVIVFGDAGTFRTADPGGCGSVVPAGDGSQAAAIECDTEWDINVQQAVKIAQQRGVLPGAVRKFIEEASRVKTNWREILRQFLTVISKDNYEWRRPNRRFIHKGIYLPSLHSENLGEVLVVLDTSGSISAHQLSVFMGELVSIIDCAPISMIVAYHHSDNYKVDRWTPSDGPYEIKDCVGGGTSHKWLTQEWFLEQDINPVCIVALTDLCTDFPEDPGITTYWGVIENREGVPPWGEKVEVEIDKE